MDKLKPSIKVQIILESQAIALLLEEKGGDEVLLQKGRPGFKSLKNYPNRIKAW